ncbi:MAG: DUF2726 domain-containing protein [Spirochaetia bacterium]|nr:DUF2726 domain-containing protein [Spirochaetia bacterium]
MGKSNMEVISIEQKYTYVLISGDTSDINKEVITKYWEIISRNKQPLIFKYMVKDIVEEFGLKQQEISKVVRENSEVIIKDNVCVGCGKYISVARSRSELIDDVRLFCNNEYKECNRCRKIREDEEILNKEKEEEEKIAFLFEKHNESIINTRYEELNDLEWNYLVRIGSQYTTPTQVAKKLGLSIKQGNKILNKLFDMSLLVNNPYKQEIGINDNFANKLKDIGIKNKVKPIFGSELAKKAFRQLKKKYLFVYPEIPVCAIIEKENIDHLLTESWHYNYFLTCRLDFVVTDREGVPEFGVEFQGSYHTDGDQYKKDEFKEMLLNEVGLNIQKLTTEDLKV